MNSALNTRLSSFFTSRRFIVFLIIAGIILRLKVYLQNYSFWIDEAWVAVNIQSRSWVEMFHHNVVLNDWPNRPLVFSLIQKLVSSLFGNHEYSFRLLPFLAGALSVIAFYRFLKNSVGRNVLCLALAGFAFSGQLIHFSGQLKQFSMDVLVVLILYNLFDAVKRKGFEYRGLWQLGLAGCLAMWCSHPVVFILAAFGGVLAIKFIQEGDLGKFRALIGIGFLWLLNLILIYLLVIQHTIGFQHLLNYWQSAFMPPPGTLAEVIWLANAILNFQHILIRTPFPLFITYLGMLGVAAVFRRDKELFLLLFLPFIFCVFASALHKYPFEGRFLLFLAPAGLIFTAEGIALLARSLNKRAPVLVPLMIAVLFFYPVSKAGSSLWPKRGPEENREVLQYLSRNVKPGDQVYLYRMAEPAFLYYANYFHLWDKFSIVAHQGEDGPRQNLFFVGRFKNITPDFRVGGFCEALYLYNKNGYRETFVPRIAGVSEFSAESVPPEMRYPRVWVYIAHYKPGLKKLVLESFDRHGKRVDTFEGSGAAVYLYSFHPS